MGRLNVLHAYTDPMQMCTATAPTGMNQRLNEVGRVSVAEGEGIMRKVPILGWPHYSIAMPPVGITQASEAMITASSERRDDVVEAATGILCRAKIQSEDLKLHRCQVAVHNVPGLP